MTKILSYSFSLTPPAPPAPTEQLHESDAHGAATIISADFYEIPEAKAQAVAERCLG